MSCSSLTNKKPSSGDKLSRRLVHGAISPCPHTIIEKRQLPYRHVTNSVTQK